MLSNNDKQTFEPKHPWVRGVNLGGWLVMERYITPYQFAVTDCHLNGDICWYPGQESAPPTNSPEYKECDLSKCRPIRITNEFNKTDYPVDEKTLSKALLMAGTDDKEPLNGTSPDIIVNYTNINHDVAEKWFNSHFEYFFKREDIVTLKKAGVTHMRVPLPHWILGDVLETEPWIVGKRWEYFVRLCHWARELNMYVWPDIHTAPGSQNGFDNSGQALPQTTCQHWQNNTEHIQRSLDAIDSITKEVKKEGLSDVVTGFGLLNEPFADCNRERYDEFIDSGLDIVRSNLGTNTSVYVSDLFMEQKFNNNSWWLDPTRYNNTFLDSHYYEVFSLATRDLSPKQHIAFACQNLHERATSCCYQDPPDNTIPSEGVSRMVGEWSADYDKLPAAQITALMESIAETGEALDFNRKLTKKRKDFLKKFSQAQMVAYEAADKEVASAWFYWTAKMEGGAFAEWSFLRGIEEGWMPSLPSDPTEPSENKFGTCYDILLNTKDDWGIVDEYPDPQYATDTNITSVDDDVVLSHGAVIEAMGDNHDMRINYYSGQARSVSQQVMFAGVLFIVIGGVWKYFKSSSRRAGYSQLKEAETTLSV